MTAWWLSDDCLMLFWWLPNYWLRAANFPMPVQWLHDPKHLNQLSPDSKVLKRIQILLSGESWRVDLGSRAAAGTAAAATADSAHCCSWCGSPHSAQLLSAEELPKIFGLFAVGLVCTIPTLPAFSDMCHALGAWCSWYTDCLSKGKTIYALTYDHTTVYLEFFWPIAV